MNTLSFAMENYLEPVFELSTDGGGVRVSDLRTHLENTLEIKKNPSEPEFIETLWGTGYGSINEELAEQKHYGLLGL